MSLPSPVVFVPGIMGSALRDEYPVSPEPVWTVLRAAIKSYERITLHPDNLRYEVREPARVVKDQVFGLFYEEIIEELRHNLSMSPDAPVPVFPFAYDWRQPLVDTQRQLADFIEEVAERTALLRHYHADAYDGKQGKVSLVGHSMGGLVIGGYLMAHGNERVDKIATLASPFRGSIEAIAKTAIGVGGFSIGSGGSREREAARVTPSLYHLLPSFEKAVMDASGSEADIYLPRNWQPGVIATIQSFVERYSLSGGTDGARATEILKGMLDQAWRHRSSLERLRLEDTRDWLCIVGVGSRTRLRVSLVPDANAQPRFEIGEPIDEWDATAPSIRTGDGTVPFVGARCAFIPEEEVVCVEPGDFGPFEFKDKLINQLGFHSAIPNMNAAQRMVANHLMGRRTAPGVGRPSPSIQPGEWSPPWQEPR